MTDKETTAEELAKGIVEGGICKYWDHDGPNPWHEASYDMEVLKESISQAITQHTADLLDQLAEARKQNEIEAIVSDGYYQEKEHLKQQLAEKDKEIELLKNKDSFNHAYLELKRQLEESAAKLRAQEVEIERLKKEYWDEVKYQWDARTALKTELETLKTQLEQSEARLALVVKRLHSYGDGVVLDIEQAAAQYKESLLAKGREQGVRDCLDKVHHVSLGHYNKNDAWDRGYWHACEEAKGHIKDLLPPTSNTSDAVRTQAIRECVAALDRTKTCSGCWAESVEALQALQNQGGV